MVRGAEVIVVGGGVIGCAIAYFAAARGLDVLVVERDHLAGGASGANAGGVTVSHREPGPALAFTRESARLVANLSEELRMDIEYVHSGSVRVLWDDEDIVRAEAFAAERRAAGVQANLLDGREARELEPCLAPDILGGLHVPDDGHLNPIALTHAYARRALELGARFLVATPATRFLASDSRVRGVATPAGDFEGETVVLAAGAWSAGLGRTIGLDIPITPSRGQLMVTEPLRPLTRRTLRDNGTIVRQLPRGTVLIGSHVEYVGFDRGVTPDQLGRFATRATGFVPALKDVRVLRAFAGLRPHTPDTLPILGRVIGYDGLFLACGHDRQGNCLSAATGLAVAELLAVGRTALPVGQFAYERFAEGESRKSRVETRGRGDAETGRRGDAGTGGLAIGLQDPGLATQHSALSTGGEPWRTCD